MKQLIQKFLKDESGATMVEYAILVALISIAAVVIIGVIGGQINTAFQNVSNALPAAAPADGGGGGG